MRLPYLTGEPRIEGGRLVVEGEISRANEAADRLIQLAKDGVKFEANVGVKPDEFEQIRDQSIQVNGRTITAGARGLSIVRRGSLKEVSILALGADPDTAVHLAAKAAFLEESASMTPTPSTDPVTIERERVLAIEALTANHPTIRASAISSGWSSLDTEVAVLRHEKQQLELANLRESRPLALNFTGSRHAGPELSRAAIETSLLLRLGREDLAVQAHGADTVRRARLGRLPTLLDVCSLCLGLDGRPSNGLTDSQLIRAGFSTVSLPDILSGVTGRALVAAYEEGTQDWRKFADIRSAQDFKAQAAIRPSVIGQLEQLGEAGEIKHLQLGEDTIDWQVNTFARMIMLTRKMVINDDLGAFSQMALLLGQMGARSVNDLVWRTLLLGAGAHFTAARGNLLEAGSALSVDSLSAAETLMRKQTDPSGQDISIVPRVLVVPPELGNTARSILNSTMLGTSDGSPTGNPLLNIVDLVVESRLSNASYTGASSTAWYLFGGPMSVPLIVGFLREQQVPVVEAFGLDHEVETLGFSWRVYLDYGVALGEYRAGVKATGAAA
jgi:hypothetical protein